MSLARQSRRSKPSAEFPPAGPAAIGGAVALIEPLCNTLVFYLHERAWQRFGRQKASHSYSYGHDVFLRYMSRGQRGANRAARSSR
ncbi:DUF2061 domain-containing protein [Pseudomonas sp. LM13]